MSLKKMRKAYKALNKIESPSDEMKMIIEALGTEIFVNSEETSIEDVINRDLSTFEDKTLSFSKRRDALTNVLENGAKIVFNYEKKDNSVRAVNVAWSDDYTYDIPPENSDFIFMYDEDDDYFKHFKLDKISDISIKNF